MNIETGVVPERPPSFDCAENCDCLLDVDVLAPEALGCPYGKCLLLWDISKCALRACLVVGAEALVGSVCPERYGDAIEVVKEPDAEEAHGR